MLFSVLLHVISPIAASDTQTSESSDFAKTCMRLSVGVEEMGDQALRVFLQVLELIDADKNPRDPCDWRGVHCFKGVIKNIFWTNLERSRFKTLDWLPPGLSQILVLNMPIRAPFDTRKLPKSSTFCGFVSCLLYGPLSLRTLPRDLIELNLNTNNLSGTVHVAELPESIFHIDLTQNVIQKFIVFQLPSSLHQMYIQSRVKKLTVKYPDGAEPSDRIQITEHPSMSDCFTEFLNLCV